jgi:uncharacterized repeat protein (TIGR02543 family)
MLVRWNKASLTWVKVALAMALFSSFTLMAETSASANSTATLYVAQGGAGIGNCADLGDACSSLQTAIGLADGQTNTDVTIDVAAGTYDENDTINLPSTDTLVIQGAGATTTFINGSHLGSDFTIGAGGQVTLEALKIENGEALGNGSGASGYGGGIYNQSGTLTVDDSIFSSDVAIGAPSTTSVSGGNAGGGAIYDESGELALYSDTFTTDSASGGSGNGTSAGGSAYGGAIDVEGGTVYTEVATFNDDTANGGASGASGGVGGSAFGGAASDHATSSSFYLTTFSNDATNGGAGGVGVDGGNGYGGGLYSSAGDTTLTKDTFSNDATNGGAGGVSTGGSAFGGGFNASGATAELIDDTFFTDSATAAGNGDAFGGAIDNVLSTTTAQNVTIAYNTVTGNTGSAEGAGVYIDAAFSLANSILDQSDSCDGSAGDLGYNVESDNTCGLGGSDKVSNSGINLASSLAANGSPDSQTLAISQTSSAYEEVPIASCTYYAADERGEPRPGVTGANCDAGAYEFEGYFVTYDPNTGSNGPIDLNTYGPGEIVEVLFSTPPTLSGYGFGGWCTVQEAVATPCSGTVFPNGSFPVTELTMGTANVTLYALWDTPTTLYVNASDNGSTCADATTNACPTIQDAINIAQSLHNSAVTINVAAGTYHEDDVIDLTNNDTIDIIGAGVDSTFMGDSSGPDIAIDLGIVSIEGLTIEDGSNGSHNGGGIEDYGVLSANNDTFTGNQAGFGGGIFDDGTLTANNDTFTGNQAGGGGGIYVAEEGTLTAANDTFTGNQAGAGGGLYNDSAATVASTTSDTFYDSAATLTNDTFYDDSTTTPNEGDAIANQDSPITISNSILDESYSCTGSFPTNPDGGYNVESDNTCQFVTSVVTSSTINVATALDANGSSGPETLAIDPTSSAYQEVPIGRCTITTDERGDPRPGTGSSCDAGAFEYQSPPIIILPPTPTTTTTTIGATDTVTFASDGGSTTMSVSGASGSSVTLPAAPTFAGHVFKGWFTQASGGTLVGLGGAAYSLTGSLTLYAQWTAKTVTRHLVMLGTVHTFALGSSVLTTAMQHQVAAFAKVIRSRHYVNVSLEGKATLPANAANRQLALARARSVEGYLKILGLATVHYTLSEKVTGTTPASLVVVVASS